MTEKKLLKQKAGILEKINRTDKSSDRLTMKIRDRR